MSNINTEQIISSPIRLRVCPFCAAVADLRRSGDPPLFGVRCRGCRAGFEPIHPSEASALIAWNQRRGSVSALGGRSTRGRTSAKKLRACRRNFKAARKAKALKMMRSNIEHSASLLRAARQVEMDEAQAAAAERRARLAALLPRLEADPGLCGMVELFKPRLAHAGHGTVDHGA